MDGFPSGGFMFHVNFPSPEWDAQMPPAVPLWPDLVPQRIQWRWAEYERMCRKAQRVDDDRVPYLSNVQSPMDIVALIWDKADLFAAMIDTPDAVSALAEKVRALLVAFFDEWFRRYGTTFVAHYPDYVMNGGITMSVDEVGAVSDELFRTFFRDELSALSKHFGGLGIHCCADARHQWGNFRDLPGLKLINHNLPPTRQAQEYLPDALRFYGTKVAQMPIGWTPDGPPESWPAQFPEGSRVVFEVQAEDMDRAAAIAERLQGVREAWKRNSRSIIDHAVA